MTVECGDVVPVRFTLRIGHFSSGDALASHVFRTSKRATGWSLSVQPRQEDSSTSFLLHRWGPFRLGPQTVRVRMTVMDLLSSRLLTVDRRVHFSGVDGESHTVMRLTREQMSGWCGLKGLCFLPNDTLTLRCEIDESDEKALSVEGTPYRCGWRDSYLLSVHATGVPLA